jgi:hypothetical protein
VAKLAQVWRRAWNLTAGLSRARVQAARIGRDCSDLRHGAPLA